MTVLGREQARGLAICEHLLVAEIAVTLEASGEAYVALVVGPPPEVRDSVALDALDAADSIPALEGLVLEFDYYGRLIGLRVTGSAHAVLAPSLLEAAEHEAPQRRSPSIGQ